MFVPVKIPISSFHRKSFSSSLKSMVAALAFSPCPSFEKERRMRSHDQRSMAKMKRNFFIMKNYIF